jgi:hypothetical protein
MVLKKIRDFFKPKQINGPHPHEFALRDVVNILVDPKCLHCPKTMSQLNAQLDVFNKPFVYQKKTKFRLIKGSGNA